MSAPGFWIVTVVGLVFLVLPHWVAKRTVGRPTLTHWILSFMGLGIVVGGLLRYGSPLTFAPEPARVTSASTGPFDGAGETRLTVNLPGGPISLVIPPSAQPRTAKALAVAINDAELARARIASQGVQIRAFDRENRVGIASTARGSSASLSVTSDALDFPAQTAQGRGESTSFLKKLHDFLKDLFINALKMMVVPVIFTSIISGMLSLGSQDLGRLGLKTIAYYMATSVLAILVGLFLVNLIQPGADAILTLEEKPTGFEDTASQSATDFLFAFFRDLIPVNPVKAMVDGDILSVIFFAILVGFFTNRLPQNLRDSLSTTFNALFEVMLLIVRTVLWLAPLGVYAIFVKVIAETGPEAFVDLAWYALTVLLGLVIHATVVLPLLVRVFGRVSPWRHAKAMGPALLTAFSTSSSSAALPVTMRCVEERAGVSNKTSSFVLPLGATVNMDGTALYECVAAIFIAQIYVGKGVIDPLTVSQQILVVFTALMASIGAAGIPMAGMVMLGIILKALNLPLEGVGYILAVDRFLDMCRTTVNVWSDSCGCVVIARSEGETDVLSQWPPPRII